MAIRRHTIKRRTQVPVTAIGKVNVVDDALKSSAVVVTVLTTFASVVANVDGVSSGVVDVFVDTSVAVEGGTIVAVVDTFAIVLIDPWIGVDSVVEETSVYVAVVVAVVEVVTRPGVQSEFDFTLKNSISPRCTQLEPGERINCNMST